MVAYIYNCYDNGSFSRKMENDDGMYESYQYMTWNSGPAYLEKKMKVIESYLRI